MGALLTPTIGTQPVASFWVVDTTKSQKLGTIVTETDSYFGAGEFIYLSIPTSTAFTVGSVVVWDNNFSATAVPNTANLGQPVALSHNAVASNAASVQYGWFKIGGTGPLVSTASVAANAGIGIAAAGKGGAIANGKQLLNAKVQVAATTTVVKSANVQSGSLVLTVPSGYAGWFVGVALSGTGIASGATVAGLGTDGVTVTMSAAATASGYPSVTGTYNDGTLYYNVVSIDRPFAQGQAA